jgi:hypothetical protein
MRKPFDIMAYSNKSRGLRKKTDADNQLPAIISGEMSSKQFRRNWVRLIKKSTKWTPWYAQNARG